jgi:catechol 2,3-dioxygenase-like lactoylglutathione lyase family enzyme
MIPTLDGVHHLKLPVSDLDRSIHWYGECLGYRVAIEFRSNGQRSGVTMTHPAGGPWLGLVLDAERARAAAGFDYFSIGVPDRTQLEGLADHLTALGQRHAGVHFATVGWILPMLHDPDGHEVRFYTTQSHAEIDPDSLLVIDDAVATAGAEEQEWLARQTAGPVDEERG